jgi:hypothetical protein
MPIPIVIIKTFSKANAVAFVASLEKNVVSV